jgi:hypothetical protein
MLRRLDWKSNKIEIVLIPAHTKNAFGLEGTASFLSIGSPGRIVKFLLLIYAADEADAEQCRDFRGQAHVYQGIWR